MPAALHRWKDKQPGIVFTSFTYTLSVSSSIKKSIRITPVQPNILNVSFAKV